MFNIGGVKITFHEGKGNQQNLQVVFVPACDKQTDQVTSKQAGK